MKVDEIINSTGAQALPYVTKSKYPLPDYTGSKRALPEEDIRRAYLNGMPMIKILSKFDITKMEQQRICKDLPSRRKGEKERVYLNVVQKDKLYQDHLSGMTTEEIKKKYNVSDQTVYRICNGDKKNCRQVIAKETKEEIRKDFLAGVPTKDILAKYKISKTARYNICRGLYDTRKRRIAKVIESSQQTPKEIVVEKTVETNHSFTVLVNISTADKKVRGKITCSNELLAEKLMSAIENC